MTNVHTYCCHRLDPVHTSKSQSVPALASQLGKAQTKLSVKPILLFAYWPHAWFLAAFKPRVQVINAKPIFIASNNNKTHTASSM